MSCEPEKVTGLVDGALASGEAARLQTHLDGCGGCRGQAAAERAVHERLARLPIPEMPPGLEARLRARLRERRGLRRLRSLPLAAAVTAAVLLAAFWVRGLPGLVVWELSLDHDHCYSRGLPPATVRSPQPEVVGAWFLGQGTRLPQVPARVGPAGLFGGRHCLLADASVTPHLYYLGGDHRLSVFVMPHDVRMDGGLFRSSSRGRAVSLVRVGGRLLGVVGERPDDVDATVRDLRGRLEAAAR